MIKSHTIENKFLRVKTLNMGATLYEVYHKKKKINLILSLDKISSYQNNFCALLHQRPCGDIQATLCHAVDY